METTNNLSAVSLSPEQLAQVQAYMQMQAAAAQPAAPAAMSFPQAQPIPAANAWGTPVIQQIPQWESVSIPLNIELESGAITPMLTFSAAAVPTPQALNALLNALEKAGFPLKTWKKDAKKSWGK